MTTTKAAQQQDEQDAREHLRRVFTPDSIINTQIVHATNARRLVQVYVVVDGGRVWDCSIVVARAIGYRYQPGLANGASGIVVNGGGFDAGHDVAYTLRWALFGGESQDALEGLQHNRV